MLMEDHTWERVEAAHKFLQGYKTDGEELLDSIVTGDKTWVHYMTLETKQQSRQWKHPESPNPQKFKQIRTVFWQNYGERVLGQERVIVV